TQGKDPGVRGRIHCADRAIVAAPDYPSIQHDDGADRNLAFHRGAARLLQRESHEFFVIRHGATLASRPYTAATMPSSRSPRMSPTPPMLRHNDVNPGAIANALMSHPGVAVLLLQEAVWRAVRPFS